jgi:hypothetical protein
MKPAYLQILQHSLGCDEYGTPPRRGGERNYYGTDPDDVDCNELVALGYMDKGSPKTWTPDIFFTVTEAGKQAMREASPVPPKVTRSQKRYQDFLDASDVWGCSFREYLDIIRSDWYKDMRARG